MNMYAGGINICHNNMTHDSESISPGHTCLGTEINQIMFLRDSYEGYLVYDSGGGCGDGDGGRGS